MSAKVVTLRSELMRSIGDFLRDANMACAETQEALIAITVDLVDYREEGRPLFPRMLICDGLETVLKNLQGAAPIEIGKGPREPETVRRALKKCAPLTENGWAIWIERRPDQFGFGVFREPAVTAIDLRSTLLDTAPSSPLQAVLLAQVGPGTIEMISAGKAGIRIHLSGQREELISVQDAQLQIVGLTAADLDDDRARQAYVSFMTTVLHDLLRKGHGTLVAVVPRKAKMWTRYASDAVMLDEPLDIALQLERHSAEPSSAALSELLATVDLVAGMLSSDGITVFDTAGRVLAFNWFVPADNSKLTARERLGGARHRAFAALVALVDKKHVRGAFIRSSDGTDRAYERNNDA